jgi:hypothetical protein
MQGERESKLKLKLQESNVRKSLNDMLKSEVERLEALTKGTAPIENLEYRMKMDEDREKLSKQERKKISREHEILARNTGLHGSVLSIMMEDADAEEQNGTDIRDKKEKKQKRDKKSKKDKKSKDKKKKKDKKMKKEKSTRVKRKHEEVGELERERDGIKSFKAIKTYEDRHLTNPRLVEKDELARVAALGFIVE